MAVDGAGNIIAVGREFTAAQGFDIWIQQYGPDRRQRANDGATHDGAQSSDDQAGDVAIGPDGGVVVIGTVAVIPMINSDVWLRKYGP